MATSEQVEKVFRELESSNPAEFFSHVNGVCVDIGAVIGIY